jgi:hypothetical protein
MAVTQFKDISWNPNEPIDVNKLNTMASNARYFFERAPKLYYNSYGVQKDTGIKIASGVATVPPNNVDYNLVNVYFGSFFTPGCNPVINIGCMSPVQGRIMLTFVSLNGHGSSVAPDHRGFIARLGLADKNPATQYFVTSVFIHWTAFGY